MESNRRVSVDQNNESPEDNTARRSLARSRFNKAALSVLSQVYDQKSSDAGGNDNGGKPKDEQTPRKARLSLASVVKAVRLRKGNRKDSLDGIGEDLEAPLPETPRWCSQLSSEAQVAMMTCYQDKLIEGLQGAYPEQTKSLVRVQTPKPKQLSTQTSSSSDDFAEPPDDPSVLQKRRVSGTFETAMHILDQLKESRGEHITSRPSVGQAAAPPLTRYNHWAKKWETVLVPEEDGSTATAVD